MHHRRTHSVGADAHIGPLGTGIKSTIVEPRRKPVRAGIKPAPTRRPGGGSVGADFISARAARPRRTHHRRTHSVGADAHIGPLGTGIKSTIAERTRRGARIRSRVRFTQRWRSMYPVPAACGHAALRPQRPANCLARRSWRADVGIGPYEKTESGSVGADGGMRSADCLAHGRPADAPYGERNHRTPARNGNWFRAAIQAAPTRGAGIRPDSGPFRSDGAQSADGARWTSRWSPHSR